MQMRALDLSQKGKGCQFMLIRTALDVQKEVGLNQVPGNRGGVMVPGTNNILAHIADLEKPNALSQKAPNWIELGIPQTPK